MAQARFLVSKYSKALAAIGLRNQGLVDRLELGMDVEMTVKVFFSLLLDLSFRGYSSFCFACCSSVLSCGGLFPVFPRVCCSTSSKLYSGSQRLAASH